MCAHGQYWKGPTPLEGVKKDLAIDLRAIPIMMPFSVPIDTWQIRKRKQTQITVVCTFLLLRYFVCACNAVHHEEILECHALQMNVAFQNQELEKGQCKE